MKNKILFRFITLTLILVLCLGAVACGSGNTDTETSETTAADTVADTTADSGEDTCSEQSNADREEALFAEVLAAYDATAKYTGPISLSITQVSSSNSEDYSYSLNSNSFTSFDMANNIYFSKSEATLDGVSYTDIEKVFAVDGEFYSYDSYTYVNTENEEDSHDSESYSKHSPEIDADEQMGYFIDILDGFIGGPAKAESFAALKETFSDTYNEIKARETAKLIEDGELAQGATIDLTPEISIKRASGEVVFTIVTGMSAAELVDGDEITSDLSVVYTRSISCKGGKITGVEMNVTTSGNVSYGEPAENSAPEPAEKVEISSSMKYVITYAFDQAGYNAIAVSLPENPDEIGDGTEDEAISIAVKFGDLVAYESYVDGTAAEFIDNVANDAEWEFGYDSSYDEEEGWIDVCNVTIHGIYKDASFTQPITAETTREELIALDCVYADYTVRDGYAIIMENYDSVQEFSLDYQIIMSDPYGLFSGDIGSKSGRAVSASEIFDFSVSADEDYKITVNGAAVTGTSMPLENGKIYDIKYTRVYTDKDFDLSILFMDMI